MALDAANFISELSITDPPGTDPLSQGDDQIRTIKRATFQSFPNVDKEVSLTADQLNLAAIKNETNTFTATQTIDANLQINDSGDNARSIGFQVAALNRWQFQQQSSSSNRNFRFRRFDSLGASIDVPWECDATTGIIDFAQVPTVLGAPLWIAGEIRMFAATSVPGTNWFKADGTNGTVNCEDRWLAGSGAFAGAAGVELAAALNSATAAAGNTGSTAISIAQMPNHGHSVRDGSNTGITDVQIGFTSNETVVGGNRGNSAGKYTDKNSSGNDIIQHSGSGSGHTHTSPAQNVAIGSPTFTNSVQPLSRVVDIFQYVP